MSRVHGAGRNGLGAVSPEVAAPPAEPGSAEPQHIDLGVTGSRPADPRPAGSRADGSRAGGSRAGGSRPVDPRATGRDAADSQLTDHGVLADAGPGASVRAVVVDDHPVVRDGLVAMLGSDPNIEVVGVAADGREALKIGRAHV